MKETPLLFVSKLARKVREGRKTQTRRVIKQQPPATANVSKMLMSDWLVERWPKQPREFSNFGRCETIICPYGQVGDRLWVKETHFRYGRYAKNGLTKRGNQRWRFVIKPSDRSLIAFGELKVLAPTRQRYGWHKRPSIFLPRVLSRTTLELVSVRVERVQDISEADAKAEGCETAEFSTGPTWGQQTYRAGFANLWNSINAERGYSWESNPWVWVLEFK